MFRFLTNPIRRLSTMPSWAKALTAATVAALMVASATVIPLPSDASDGRRNGVDGESVKSGRYGLWLVRDDGQIFSMRRAPVLGPVPVSPERAVAAAATQTGNGMWVLDSFGRVHTTGDATHYGDLDRDQLEGRERPVHIVAADDTGYMIITSRGAVQTRDPESPGPVITDGEETEGTDRRPGRQDRARRSRRIVAVVVHRAAPDPTVPTESTIPGDGTPATSTPDSTATSTATSVPGAGSPPTTGESARTTTTWNSGNPTTTWDSGGPTTTWDSGRPTTTWNSGNTTTTWDSGRPTTTWQSGNTTTTWQSGTGRPGTATTGRPPVVPPTTATATPGPTPVGPAPGAEVPSHLNDANRQRAAVGGAGAFIDRQGYPRVMFTEPQGAPAPHGWLGKYPMLAFQGSGLHAAEAAQRANPETPLFRMFTPRLTLENIFDRYGDCTQGLGIPFARSAATTGGCNVWAGHFLYNAGTRLAAPMAANASTIEVDSAQGFNVGEYVAIHDGGPTEFRNAEHARITAVNGNRLTLSGRTKSTSRARQAGAMVRQHEADSGNKKAWVFNMSTEAPRDPNGVHIVDYMADFLVDNLKADLRNNNLDVSVKGLTFDVDTYVDVFTNRSDANNDLRADGGISPTGTHWWGEGTERFYRRLRQQLPDSVIVGGTQFSYGFDHNNGMQIEGFPNGPLHRPVDDYSKINFMMSSYLYHMGVSNRYGPRTVQLLMKHGTAAYPTHGVSPSGNAAVRLGLALTSMDGGVFHHENTPTHYDTWYDEYSVYTDRGSSNYGRAVAHGNVAAARTNTGWLGEPIGSFHRVVDDAAFGAEQALTTSNFEGGTDGWRGRSVTVSRTSASSGGGQGVEGSGALAVSTMNQFKAGPFQAAASGPSVQLQAGQDYTITFAAKADEHRWVRVGLGDYQNDVLVGPQWRRYVIPFRATRTTEAPITIGVGRQNVAVSLDAVRVFSGDANVFRRDFENGVVIANATPNPVTVDLGSGYRRIDGSQDPINDGRVLPSTVTIAPFDGLFAIRS